jgi:DNA-binding response OmpR family regulator
MLDYLKFIKDKVMTKEKILVVDDEEDILELVRYNLSREGYKIICAASGEEGLKTARTENPDLIVLDLMLPGLDGLDTYRDADRQGRRVGYCNRSGTGG